MDGTTILYSFFPAILPKKILHRLCHPASKLAAELLSRNEVPQTKQTEKLTNLKPQHVDLKICKIF